MDKKKTCECGHLKNNHTYYYKKKAYNTQDCGLCECEKYHELQPKQ